MESSLILDMNHSRCNQTFESFLLERAVHCFDDEQEFSWNEGNGGLAVPSQILLLDHLSGIHQFDSGLLSPSSLQRELLQSDEKSFTVVSRARCNQDCCSCETLEQLDELLDTISLESEELPFDGPRTISWERFDLEDPQDFLVEAESNDISSLSPTSLSPFKTLSFEALETSINAFFSISNLSRTTSSGSCFPVLRSNTSSQSVMQSRSVPPSSAEKTMPDKMKSRVSPESMTSITPAHNDVLCGKGQGTNKSGHNKNFRRLCKMYAKTYRETTKRRMVGKKGIAMKIVKEIQSNNGRFLKQNGHDDSNIWVEISDNEAAKKVAHCIRDFNRRSCR